MLARIAQEPRLRLRGLRDAQALLPARVGGRLALLERGARLAHLRLHGGGAQGRARDAQPAVHPRALRGHPRRAPLQSGERDPHAAKRRRRVCDVREQPRLPLVRVAQPVGGLWRHHDRLLVRRVLDGVALGHLRLPPGLPGAPLARGAGGDRGRPTLHQVDPARGRLVVRLVGLLLHLRHVVWRRGPRALGRAQALRRAPPCVPFPPLQAERERRLGRGLHLVLRQGLRAARRAALGQRRLGRRQHRVGIARADGGRLARWRRDQARRRVPHLAAARHRRLGPGGHHRRLQPRLRHFVHAVPQHLPHLGARSIRPRVRAPCSVGSLARAEPITLIRVQRLGGPVTVLMNEGGVLIHENLHVP
mmetsp:Transcript_9676/g.30641  ORF Transcript_9676/g.30641 Transcript_9676/m.30641 type:complete len:363 (-) Transcript_9676:75-1163(-)